MFVGSDKTSHVPRPEQVLQANLHSVRAYQGRQQQVRIDYIV